jgi:hypothetical protein
VDEVFAQLLKQSFANTSLESRLRVLLLLALLCLRAKPSDDLLGNHDFTLIVPANIILCSLYVRVFMLFLFLKARLLVRWRHSRARECLHVVRTECQATHT